MTTLCIAQKPGSFSSQVYQGLQDEVIAYIVTEPITDNYIYFSTEVICLTLLQFSLGDTFQHTPHHHKKGMSKVLWGLGEANRGH